MHAISVNLSIGILCHGSFMLKVLISGSQGCGDFEQWNLRINGSCVLHTSTQEATLLNLFESVSSKSHLIWWEQQKKSWYYSLWIILYGCGFAIANLFYKMWFSFIFIGPFAHTHAFWLSTMLAVISIAGVHALLLANLQPPGFLLNHLLGLHPQTISMKALPFSPLVAVKSQTNTLQYCIDVIIA